MTGVAGTSERGRAGDAPGVVRFCSYCGAFATGEATSASERRVCPGCGLGVLLNTRPDVLARPGAAFLVVTPDLRVSAASSAVSTLVGRPDQLVGAPILAILTGTGAAAGELAAHLSAAATGMSSTVADLTLETLGTRAETRRLAARIAPCGRPPAALVALEAAL